MSLRASGSRIFSTLVLILAVVASPGVRADQDDPYALARLRMIERDIAGRGIRDKTVLDALSRVPRHLFVDEGYRDRAYGDHPLPIGEGQTISQPYVVALMTEALRLRKSDRVLEVGTGSGYQAAVLAEIVKKVYSLEIRPPLAERSARTLRNAGYANVTVRNADGYYGWTGEAPFDAIIITASANHIPPPLIEQLRDGGRLIVPLGRTVYYQVLTLVTKRGSELDIVQLGDVAFVPMVGEMRKGK